MLQHPEPSPNFEIFTSLRSDGLLLNHQGSQFYMLSSHKDRLLTALNAFHWPITKLSGPSGLPYFEELLHEHLLSTYSDPLYPNPLKIRVLISPSSEVLIDSTPVPPVPLSTLFPYNLSPTPSAPPTWSIYLSPHPNIPNLHTTHKTTLRTPYNHARSLIPTPPPSSAPPSDLELASEILLHNPSSEITEGTLTTPYFFRSGAWLTPPASSGGNQGTTRRWALQGGLCVEGVVRKEDVRLGEVVWLSNGVRGWGWGRVELL